MPFGLENVPETLQRAFGAIISTEKWQYAHLYLCDKVVIFEEHRRTHGLFEKGIEASSDSGFNLKLETCNLFADNINYLGTLFGPGDSRS